VWEDNQPRWPRLKRVLLAGRLDDPGQHQVSEHLVTAGCVIEPQQVVHRAQGIPQMSRTRTDNFQRAAGDLGRVQSEVECALASASRWRPAALSASNSDSLWAEPRCSMRREPRGDDQAICTAIAPDLASPSAHRPPPHPTNHRLVRTSALATEQNPRSMTHNQGQTRNVSYVSIPAPCAVAHRGA
jgi:hypothetical protein